MFSLWLLLLAMAPGCHPVEGDQITMADLAAVDTRFATADPAQSAGFSPAPGSQRVFYAGELSRLAVRAGAEASQPFTNLCFERRTREVKPEEVIAAIRDWAPSEAKIEVVEQSKFAAPPGRIVFVRPANPQATQDGSILIRGYVEWGKAQRFPLWARVRITARVKRAITSVDLAAGTKIQADQVRVEDTDAIVDGTAYAQAADQVIGQVTHRRIPAGSGFPLSALETPKQVREGAVVRVEVRNGGAHLELTGRAEADGRTGDMISVRNPSSGKAFRARVVAENAVLVLPQGGLASK